MNRVIVFVFLMMIQANQVFASAGGKIAKELFSTPAGKIFGAILGFILLPLIIRSWYKKNKAIKATQQKLVQLSRIDQDLFDEINLRNRMTDVFSRVHKAWSERDLDTCADFMTDWYRRNQQTVYLDEWDSKGLMNICSIQEVKNIQPLHIRITENPNFEGSRIMYAINAHMEDYLVSIEDSSLIEGKKGFKDVETVWTLKLVDRQWKVDNIEESVMILSYQKMEAEISDSIIEQLISKRGLA